MTCGTHLSVEKGVIMLINLITVALVPDTYWWKLVVYL